MKIMYVAFLLASIYLSSLNAAHNHAQHKNDLITKCSKISFSQSCAKTMSSSFDKNGRLWSTWSNGNHLYVNYSNDNGYSFSNGTRVNSVPEKIAAGGEHRPKIKVSNEGVIYLSWTQKLEKRFTGNIRFSYSFDNGRTFSKPITVNDNIDMISHRFDTLGVNKKGDVYISWLDKRDYKQAIQRGDTYSGAAVYFALLDSDGLSFSINTKIIDNSCECCRMALDFDVSDLPVIAWRHVYSGNIRDHSLVSFRSKRIFNTLQRLSRDHWKIDGCPHQGPSISISNDNTYHAVWFNDGSENQGIFYAYSKDEGVTFSPPISVGRYENNASHADVISFDDMVYILWYEYHHTKYYLYSMKSENNGLTWFAPKLISSTYKKADSPFLIVNSNTVFASWHTQGSHFRLIPLK